MLLNHPHSSKKEPMLPSLKFQLTSPNMPRMISREKAGIKFSPY